ncbi:MAG: Maf family protein [Chitinophagales bacterium]
MNILLASTSPRRKQILTDAGFDVEILKTEVDESFPESLSVTEVPVFLAKKKMTEAVRHAPPEATILTADTIVVLNNEIIGKPIDEEDAKGILRRLSGNMHEVISGVCIRKNGEVYTFDSITRVFIHVLTEEEINFYISTYKPFDKAGAYAIQEWIGLNKIYKIEGDYYNVVGLPMSEVYRKLRG